MLSEFTQNTLYVCIKFSKKKYMKEIKERKWEEDTSLPKCLG